MNDLDKNYSVSEIKRIARKELLSLGYLPIHKGFKYLVEVIGIRYLNHKAKNFSKDIYPIIAEKHKTNITNVKYDIRNATISMYYNCPEEILTQYLGYSVSKVPRTKQIVIAIENHINP